MYINLARRTDRRARLAVTLADGNTPLLAKISRLEAVDGRRIDLDRDDLRRYVSDAALRKAQDAQRQGAFTLVHKGGDLVKWHDHLTAGAVACAMSHHAALEVVAEHPTASWGLILEDDVEGLVPNVHEVIGNILGRVPADWDAVFLGYHGGVLAGACSEGKDVAHEDMRARLELQIDEMRGTERSFVGAVDPVMSSALPGSRVLGYDVPLLRMYMPIYGLYAWMVRKTAARALLDGCFPVEGQVDRAVSQWLVRERGMAFRTAPKHLLFYSPKSEVGLDSDIQTMIELQALLEDSEACQRYMDFVGRHPSAEA